MISSEKTWIQISFVNLRGSNVYCATAIIHNIFVLPPSQCTAGFCRCLPQAESPWLPSHPFVYPWSGSLQEVMNNLTLIFRTHLSHESQCCVAYFLPY